MFPCLKLKYLEERLQCISEFEKPKILLEQYITPPHLSSHILYTVQSQYGDIDSKIVADLGSGCGALTIGTGVLGASFIIGFEIDREAIDICLENIAEQELTNIDIVNCDVINGIPSRFYKFFDTVLMNPPFGTKHNAGIDIKFLETAFKLSKNVVYSLHKTSTRKHILKYAESLGHKAEVLAELKYDLSSTYKFHKKKSVDIQVDFYRFILLK
ncbi:rRNA N6-adenosine-methyltransferase METTL5 [Diorhabda sublineata]|uniref:rRNA N6-adenosine-methyltransferase METTL5 n=1 Tax=Diorhabda sublineata TaxID=1163346 RepID=UPI0024E08D26|nr:rRNA N6-adenosine-methyltransferase METTL5 [Diorhabda sublineata]